MRHQWRWAYALQFRSDEGESKRTDGTNVTVGRTAGTPRRRQLETSGRSRGTAGRVFVVDDHPVHPRPAVRGGRDAGWEAHGFSRLASCGRRSSRRVPTLLILDDDLPDGRGGDFVRELRTHPRTADLPLLVCTAAHHVRRAEIGAVGAGRRQAVRPGRDRRVPGRHRGTRAPPFRRRRPGAGRVGWARARPDPDQRVSADDLWRGGRPCRRADATPARR